MSLPGKGRNRKIAGINIGVVGGPPMLLLDAGTITYVESDFIAAEIRDSNTGGPITIEQSVPLPFFLLVGNGGVNSVVQVVTVPDVSGQFKLDISSLGVIDFCQIMPWNQDLRGNSGEWFAPQNIPIP